MTSSRAMDYVHIADTSIVFANSKLDHSILEPGNHLILRIGKEVLSGIVDAVMPDKSCFWIWGDGGRGRRMIEAIDVAVCSQRT